MKRWLCCGAMALGCLAMACGKTDSRSADVSTDLFEGLQTHLDLAQTAHLADVYHQGWFLDFGTPAQHKYTMGGWRSGWSAPDQAFEGTSSYANVAKRGRVYFNLDTQRPLSIRIRLRGRGTRALTPYLNNHQLGSVQLSTDRFTDVEIPVTAEQARAGENQLLLTFGGATPIDGVEVSASVDWIWVREPTATAEKPPAPASPSKLRVGEDERSAVVMPQGTTMRHLVRLPKNAKLRFGVGADAPQGVDVRVSVGGADGASSVMFEGKAAGWKDHLVDLSAYGGQLVRVDFTSAAQNQGRVGWAAPQIVVPEDKAPAVPPHRNVIVLLIDTLRADKLAAFNPATRVKTPTISKLAGQGVLFEHAQSPENWTKPSVASVLTGLHPQTHQQKTGDSALPDSAVLLSEHLKTAGFATGSFIANGYVSDRFGFDQGWDDYTNYIRESKSTEAQHLFDEAAKWIEAHKDERFFAYIQTIDPHVPYDPPGSFLQMYDSESYSGPIKPRLTGQLLEKAKRRPPAVTFNARDKQRLKALHDAEITQHDHFLGEFVARLDKAGLWKDTLLVITSDHGEEFEDHGSWGHGHSVYQELLHVPLMFVSSRSRQGTRVSDTVSTMDISSTVTDAVGVEPMSTNEGRSLAPWLFGDQAPAGPSVAFSDFQNDRRVVTAWPWKLVVRGNHVASFFDLSGDPGEKSRLSPSAQPMALRYCRALLGQFLAATDKANWLSAEQGGGTTLERREAEMDDTIRGQLRALGYAH